MIKNFTQMTTNSIVATIPLNFKNQFMEWQAKLNASITSFPGFISLEISSRESGRWIVTERFNDENSTLAWQNSSKCKEILNELQTMDPQATQKINHDEINRHQNVTEVLVTQISPEKEQEYLDWSAKIHQVESKFPGFQGVIIQSPRSNQGKNWLTFLQFDTPENLDHWLQSDERKDVLKESTQFVTSLENHRVVSPFSGWFQGVTDEGKAPSLWKQTMLVLLVLFPIVMFEIKFLSPWSNQFGPSLSTFIGNALSVSLITFPMMPFALFFLGWWLEVDNKNNKQKNLIGYGLLVILYLIEIALFWNFL